MEEVSAPYLIERPAPAGYNYKPNKISHSFHSFNVKPTESFSSGGGFFQPRSHSASLYSHQIHPFIRQPPLLPAPAPAPAQRSRRSLTSQARFQSLNLKKAKSTTKEKELQKQDSKSEIVRHKSDLSSEAFRVSSLCSRSEKLNSSGLFLISPPPSSLPIPRFCLRKPKLNCKVEAAGINAGA